MKTSKNFAPSALPISIRKSDEPLQLGQYFFMGNLLTRWATSLKYPNYAVSSQGDVINNLTGKKLNPFTRNSLGYKAVNIKEKGSKNFKFVSLHRLVLLALNPDEEQKVVNHIDNNPSNNYFSNLEWCTQSHNRKHSFLHGKSSYVGAKNNMSKLTEHEVLIIKNMLGKTTIEQIAEKFNVTISCIHSIKYGYTWKHLH